jgi:hypothetical protein
MPFSFAQDKLREGVAIRHGVSLRGAAPSARLGTGCAIPVRFLAEFTLNEVNVLGMTLRARLRSLPRAAARGLALRKDKLIDSFATQ